MGSRPGAVYQFYEIFLILPAAVDPVVYPASSRDKKYFQGVEHNLCIRLTASLPCMSRFSTNCGVLNMSQPYRPPRSVTGIALLFMYR
jgi:hypothetical protein